MANSTASHSNRSTPACSPVLRPPTPQGTPEGQVAMVEKGSDHASDKTPTYGHSVHPATGTGTGRSAGKNSKSHRRLSKKSQSWYNVLSPTYKQRNEDFRKLFKQLQLPDSERLIVDYSCALQRDILLQGRLYLSENWICFYSNILFWETLVTVRLKDIWAMTKEKTAHLIPNAIQVCSGNDKHFLTSFAGRDRAYMMMFKLWQNALLEKPMCPQELWHSVHQCYGSELGLTSDDEDYVPPDDHFHSMGYCEQLPAEETDAPAATPSLSPLAPALDAPSTSRSSMARAIAATPDSNSALPYDPPPGEEFILLTGDEELMSLLLPDEPGSHAPSPSPGVNDDEDLPTELSDSSETHDEGEVQAFEKDLDGRQNINGVFKFSVDKMYQILFTESQFMREFLQQRRISDMVYHPWMKEDAGKRHQTREIKYTIPLTNPLVSKTRVTETQTLHKASQESKCYIIDAEINAHDVPYHDALYTLHRYTLTRVAKNKCRLRVSSELCYRKQPHRLTKGLIEKNFWSGLKEYFTSLESELRRAEAALSEPRPRSLRSVDSGPARLAEALSPATTPKEEEEVIPRITHVAGSTQTRHIPYPVPGGLALYSISKLLLVICFVICISLVLLMMLFYKLWMLENTIHTLTAWQDLPVLESKLPQTQMEWAQLLKAQRRYHDDELQKWKEIIKSSVTLLDEMKDSLLNLQKGISLRDYQSESPEKKNQYQ